MEAHCNKDGGTAQAQLVYYIKSTIWYPTSVASESPHISAIYENAMLAKRQRY
jgi:hypothetical protein